jgi:hypothetical protein
LIGEAQVIEQFVVASGEPLFGKQPLICGDTVVWKRYSEVRGTIGWIQGMNLSRRTPGWVNIVPHWASHAGVQLSREYVFWLGEDSTNRDILAGVHATPLSGLQVVPRRSFRVTDFGEAIAINRLYVFIRESLYLESSPLRGQIFAKPLDRLEDPEAARFVVRPRAETSYARAYAASERYFVWMDRDPADCPADTWKVYAKSMEDLFTPGAERLVYDTRIVDCDGTNLGVHDRYVVVKAAEEPVEPPLTIIVLADIEGEQEPIVLAREPNVERLVSLPAISEYYAIWTRIYEDFSHHIFGQRLEGGRPVGEVFALGQGDWATIERNIVVANGGLFLVEAGLFSTGIIATELELLGADDVGDVNADGSINISDPVALLNYLFLGEWRPRLRLADADSDRVIEITDAVVILNFLFLGGPRPGT